MDTRPTDPELLGLFARCESIGQLAELSRTLLQAMRAGETPLVARIAAARDALREALGDEQDAGLLTDAARRGGVADADEWWRRCMAVIRVADDALARRFEFLPGLAGEDDELHALVDFLLASQPAGTWDLKRDLTIICAADAAEIAVRALAEALRARGHRRIVVFDPHGGCNIQGTAQATTPDGVFAVIRDLPAPPPRLMSFAIGRLPGAAREAWLAACHEADRAMAMAQGRSLPPMTTSMFSSY